MAGLNETAIALRAQAQDEGALAGLDEQYEQAQARGVATTKQDRYGQVSPLSVLADVVRQSKSRKDLRGLTQARDETRGRIADNKNARALYELNRQQERDNVSDNQFNSTASDRKQAALKLSKAKLAQREPVDRLNPHTGKVERLEEGPNGGLYRNGVKIPDGNLYGLAPTETKDVSGSGYSNDWERKEFQKLLNTTTELEHISGKADNLPQSDLDLMNDKGTVFKHLLIQGVTPNLFDQFRKENFTGLSKSAQDFLTQINMMDSERRHALFGAALTGNENAKFDDIALAAKGLSISKMLDRLSIVSQSNYDKVVDMDTTSPHFKGRAVIDRRMEEIGAKYTPEWQESFAAQGTEDQWNELTRKQKIAFSKRFGGGSSGE